MTKELKIIEALGRHEDDASIDVLEDLGPNSSREEVREETAKALIRKNNEKALRIVIANKGKGHYYSVSKPEDFAKNFDLIFDTGTDINDTYKHTDNPVYKRNTPGSVNFDSQIRYRTYIIETEE